MSWSSSWLLWWLFSSVGCKSDARVHERAVCLCTPLIKSRSIIHGDSRCSDSMPHPYYVYWEKITHKVHLKFQRPIKHLCMITGRTLNIFTWMHLSVFQNVLFLWTTSIKCKLILTLVVSVFKKLHLMHHSTLDLFDMISFCLLMLSMSHIFLDILALMLCFPLFSALLTCFSFVFLHFFFLPSSIYRWNGPC